MRPVAVQDTESTVAAEPQAEACMDEQQTPAQAQREAPDTLTEGHTHWQSFAGCSQVQSEEST